MVGDILIPPWVKYATVAALLGGLCYGGYLHGRHVENTEWKLKDAKQEATDAKATIQQVQDLIGAKNERDKANAYTNGRVLAVLDSLRNRPETRELPASAPSGASAAGATGSGLAGPDARFLTRYAAIAARQQTALAECYAVLDAGQRARLATAPAN